MSKGVGTSDTWMRSFNDEHGDLFSGISFAAFYKCFPVLSSGLQNGLFFSCSFLLWIIPEYFRYYVVKMLLLKTLIFTILLIKRYSIRVLNMLKLPILFFTRPKLNLSGNKLDCNIRHVTCHFASEWGVFTLFMIWLMELFYTGLIWSENTFAIVLFSYRFQQVSDSVHQ